LDLSGYVVEPTAPIDPSQNSEIKYLASIMQALQKSGGIKVSKARKKPGVCLIFM
jgi:hypothetical protein